MNLFQDCHLLDCNSTVSLQVAHSHSGFKTKYEKTVESEYCRTEKNERNYPDQETTHCTEFPVDLFGQHPVHISVVVGEATDCPIDADGDQGAIVGPDYHVPNHSRVQAQGIRAPEQIWKMSKERK